MIGKAIFGLAGLAYGCALLWPTIAFLGTLAWEMTSSEGATKSLPLVSPLVIKSAWLALLATCVTMLLALPASIAIARGHRALGRPVLTSIFLSVVLAPPMVYVFGWRRLLPGVGGSSLACVFIWSLWAWPMAAIILGWAWTRSAHSAYEFALLQTSRTQAFLRVGLPPMRPYMALVASIFFVFFFNEYSVPHACGLIVYATQLLGWATSTLGATAVAWPALPSISITVCVVIVACWMAMRLSDDRVDQFLDDENVTPSLMANGLTGMLVCVSMVIPVGALCIKLLSVDFMIEAWRTYHYDLLMSLMVAVLAGVVSVLMGWGVAHSTRFNGMSFPVRMILWLSIFLGAVPGALIGESFIAAYNVAFIGWMYDHWPIVMLGYVARFSWIPMLGGFLLARFADRNLQAQAGTDGADRGGILAQFIIVMYWPVWLALGVVVAALSMAELPTSALLRVPGYTPLAHLLVEKFHRFEDGMLVSMSIWLLLASLSASVMLSLAIAALHRQR